MSRRIVIVGAGHAGGALAATLRQLGHAGPIALVGEEPLAPYQRPPLSKAWLKGEVDADQLSLKPMAFYAERDIALYLATAVQRLDLAGQAVELSDGRRLAYDSLVIATGARPVALPVRGADLAGVLSLRSAADAEQLKAALGPGVRVTVIGGGYIGLEVAASARGLGAEVTVLEREPRLLARVACPALSDFFQAYHEARGVRFRLGSAASAILGESRVAGVALSDGDVLPAEVVIVGVGARPNDTLAREAGLDCADGIVVDLDARTSAPDVFAIGDVTCRPMPIYDRWFRMESVPNALEQAKQAASAITGRPRPAGEVPWQWSDQYDIKLQIAGYPFDAEEVLLRGDPAAARFAAFHLKGDQVQAVEAVNAPAEFMMGKQLILSRRPVDRRRLLNPTIPVKAIAL